MAFPTKVIPFSQACKTWLDRTYAPKVHDHSGVYLTREEVLGIVSSSGGEFPDWSSVTDLEANTTYTANTNGFLMIGVAGGNGNRQITTTINGVTLQWNGDFGSYQYGWGCMQVYLPIKKGSTYSFSHQQSKAFARFITC